MSSESRAADIKRYKSNLRDEVDGVALYELLAAAEKDPNLREDYSRLAATEVKHRVLWETKIREAGGEVPVYKPSFRVKCLGWLARRFGTMMEASASTVVVSTALSLLTLTVLLGWLR